MSTEFPTRDDGTPRWAALDREQLADWWRRRIPAEMLADPEVDRDPDADPPPYRWLNDRYPGFVKRLQREWGLSVGEFHAEYVRGDARDGVAGSPASRSRAGDGARDAETPGSSYDWDLPATDAADATRERLAAWIDELHEVRDHPLATVRPMRSRVNLYARLYADLHDAPDLLAGLRDRDERPAEIDRAFAVCRVLDRTLGTPASKRKYIGDVRRWYRWLVDSGYADYNPMVRMEQRLGLDRPDWDNPSLSRGDVEALLAAATDREERLLVVGLAGWGLRPSELAALHVSRLVLDPDPGDDDVPADDPRPFVAFGEGDRKNGPGTVALLVGVDVLDEQLDAVAARDGWTGYVFPSTRSATGHVHVDTIRARFRALAERAGVTVRGEVPTPKYGRRWWYSIYGEAASEVAEQFTPVADAQGSASARVVVENYLSEADRRAHLRRAMEDELAAVFDGDDSPGG